MTDKKTVQVSVESGIRRRKYWLGCNWKCNGSIEFIKDSIKNMTNDVKYNQNHMGKSVITHIFVDFMILPGMLHLPLVQAIVRDGILIGAQNVSAHSEGPFTGEVSADHLANYRIESVLIGHSERRTLFNENQQVINDKIKQAWECDLNLIYCVGETHEQRDAEQFDEVINDQLSPLKTGIELNWAKTVIAYEPLWAMGTGVIASADQTQECCEIIRAWVRQNVSEKAAQDVRIVYGGNVTETNAENLIKLSEVDGFLIGSTSTKPTFRTIFEMVNKQVENEKWQ